jgi:sigma-B regulation protein RsbU (phosphoserine phosphatase)
MASNVLALETCNDLATACAVQQRFMQQSAPATGTLSYSAQCRQLGGLGGDCYDFIPLPENRLAVTIADASGKGLAAALSIASVQSSLRTAVSFAASQPAAVVEAVNRQVHASTAPGRYATLFFGVFDETTRILRYVNAGHNPPIVIRRDGSATWLNTGGLPVGMFPECGYGEGVIQLQPGDAVVAYTDGVTEATNAAGEEWGIERLCRIAGRCAGEDSEQIIDAIFSAVDRFTRGRQNDDATVVVLQLT